LREFAFKEIVLAGVSCRRQCGGVLGQVSTVYDQIVDALVACRCDFRGSGGDGLAVVKVGSENVDIVSGSEIVLLELCRDFARCASGTDDRVGRVGR
jgi:hypothetical protein